MGRDELYDDEIIDYDEQDADEERYHRSMEAHGKIYLGGGMWIWAGEEDAW